MSEGFVFEFFLEHFPCPEDAGFHGSQWDIEYL